MCCVFSRVLIVLGGVSAMFVWCAPSQAASLTVANASFEDYSLSSGGFTGLPGAGGAITSNEPILNWTVTSDGSSYIGIHHSSTSEYASGLPSGNGYNVAYADAGTISQTLSDTLMANTRYDLNVAIGRRLDGRGDDPSWGIALYAGTTLLADSGVVTASSSGLAKGFWRSLNVNYTSGATVDAGQSLKIVLTNPNRTGTANFDMVSLQTSSVPEPTAAVLAFAGIIGLLAHAWRKRRQ